MTLPPAFKCTLYVKMILFCLALESLSNWLHPYRLLSVAVTGSVTFYFYCFAFSSCCWLSSSHISTGPNILIITSSEKTDVALKATLRPSDKSDAVLDLSQHCSSPRASASLHKDTVCVRVMHQALNTKKGSLVCTPYSRADKWATCAQWMRSRAEPSVTWSAEDVNF